MPSPYCPSLLEAQGRRQARNWQGQRTDLHCCRARQKRQAAPEVLSSRPYSRARTGSEGAVRRKPQLQVEAPDLPALQTQDDYSAEDVFDEALTERALDVEDSDEDDDDDLDWEQGTVVSEETLFDFDSGWSVSAIPDTAPKANTAGKAGRTQVQAARDPAKDLSKQTAFQGVPLHVLRNLQAAQDEADAMNSRLKAIKKKGQVASKTHKRLRIIAGAFAGKTLVSGRGESTRPMMEKVRAAVFDMLLAHTTGTNMLPAGSRWLDLFAGTGSVGLEALSRGAATAHFVELDPWVSSNVLQDNIAACGRQAESTVYGGRAESFLQRASAATTAPAAYDFISVCPPYLQVSYPELFELLDSSPLLQQATFIIVEYPRLQQSEIPAAVGPLSRLTTRKYGRTHVAVYGPGA